MEDKSESLQSKQEQKPDQDVAPTDHQDSVNDAIQKAQESTDDRVVEAAAKKDGLRGALAARMDVMNRRLDDIARTRSTPLKGVLSGLNPSLRSIDNMARMPYQLGARVTGMMRDRLQPKVSVPTNKSE